MYNRQTSFSTRGRKITTRKGNNHRKFKIIFNTTIDLVRYTAGSFSIVPTNKEYIYNGK